MFTRGSETCGSVFVDQFGAISEQSVWSEHCQMKESNTTGINAQNLTTSECNTDVLTTSECNTDVINQINWD
jgi:hypothetical protein